MADDTTRAAMSDVPPRRIHMSDKNPSVVRDSIEVPEPPDGHIVLTYCSKKKAGADVLRMPAGQRYIGSHVGAAKELAISTRRPLYFISGLFGLLHEDQPVIYYDHYLAAMSTDLVRRVAGAIVGFGITDIFYYSERTEKTKPYDDTVTEAISQAALISCGVHVVRLHSYRPPDGQRLGETFTLK